jgi:hypothetical protein
MPAKVNQKRRRGDVIWESRADPDYEPADGSLSDEAEGDQPNRKTLSYHELFDVKCATAINCTIADLI